MKILIVSQYFWPEQFRINDLVLALKERGHEVTVLTGMPNYPSGKMFDGYSWWKKRHEEKDGIPVYRVPLFLRRQAHGWQLAINYLSFALCACLLAPWYFRKQEFGLIFVFQPSPVTVAWPAILMRRLKKAPMLLWVQDLWPESLSAAGGIRSPAILATVEKMVRWIYRRCDCILMQSSGFEDSIIKHGAKPEQLSCFPNWAESFYQSMDVQDESEASKLLPEGFKVMFAGNIGEAQSMETVLDAVIRLKDKSIQWVMIGEGRKKSWFEDQVCQHGLDACVHFLGQKPASDMPTYFAHVDVLLVSLKQDPVFALTIPSKVQSYLACARPIIGALDGEGAKIIRDSGAGLAVAAEDSEALAGAVLDLYRRSPDERLAMGKRGRAYYDGHFEREQLLDKLEVMMNKVVKEGLCES